MDIEKTPILFCRQAAFPDGLFDGLCLAGALPVVAAVVPAGDIFVVGIGVQDVRLLLQLMVIGVKVIAVQVTDVFPFCFIKQPSADPVKALDAFLRSALLPGDMVHHKHPYRVRVFCLPRTQFFHCAIFGAIVRAEDLHREIRFLRQHRLQRFIHIGGKSIKRDQYADLGV